MCNAKKAKRENRKRKRTETGGTTILSCHAFSMWPPAAGRRSRVPIATLVSGFQFPTQACGESAFTTPELLAVEKGGCVQVGLFGWGHMPGGGVQSAAGWKLQGLSESMSHQSRTKTLLEHTYLPTYLPTYPPTYLPTCLPACLSACLPTYLPTYPSLRRRGPRRTTRLIILLL